MELDLDSYKSDMEESDRRCKQQVEEAVMKMQMARLEAADKIGEESLIIWRFFLSSAKTSFK